MQEKVGLSLKKNFSWNFIGNLIYSLGQWLVLAIIAKMGNPEMVGIYALGLAVTAPILMLTNLQLRAVQATDTTYEYSFNDYFGLRIVTGFIALILIIIISIMSDYDINKFLIIFLVGISKILDSFSDVVYGHLQQKERMDFIGISRILKGVLTLITVGITLFLTNDLLVSLIVLNISWLIIFWKYDIKSILYFIKHITPNFNLIKFKKLVKLTFPLGLVLMIGSLNTNLPRIIIEGELGESQLGYFAALAYILIAGNTFVSAVGQAAAPRLAKLFKNSDFKKFRKLLSSLVLLGIGIGLLGVIFSIGIGELILTVFYDKTYANYNDIFILLMVSGIFNFSSSFLGHALTSMRLFKIQPYLSGIGLIVSLVGSLSLIPLFGLHGAGITLIATSFVRFMSQLIIVIRNINKVKLTNKV